MCMIFIFSSLCTCSRTLLPEHCKQHGGYTYEWPSGREPRLTQNGNQTFCKTENFVPLVVPGLSSRSTTTSSSPSPPQDLSISLDPANTRSHEGVAGNCSERIPEWLEDFAENLERSEKHPQPQILLVSQIRNVLSKLHQGSTVFLLTARKTQIARSASEPKLQDLLAEGEPRVCTPTSCCHAARTCSKGWLRMTSELTALVHTITVGTIRRSFFFSQVSMTCSTTFQEFFL